MRFARDKVASAVLDEVRARLVKVERRAGSAALLPYVEDPIITAGSCGVSRFAAAGDFLDQPVFQIPLNVDALQHRLVSDFPVLNWQAEQQRDPLVRSPLIFTGRANSHVLIAFAPVVGQTHLKAMDALGDDDKVKVAALADEAPRVLAPFVRFLNKEVGGHTGVDNAARYRVASVAFALDRRVEFRGFGDDGAVLIV